MKAALFLAAAGIAAAQNFGDEPKCAVPCLQSGIPAAGCALTDQACQCGPKQTDIAAQVAGCLIKSCSPADVISASSVGVALCSAFSASQKSGGATTTTTATTGTGGAGPTTTSFPMSPVPTSGQTIATSTSTVKNNTATTKVATTTTGTSSTPNVAATPIALGLGGLVALVGAMAAL